jgi:hypothetical protein
MPRLSLPRRVALLAAAALSAAPLAAAIDDGLGKTPVMGFNSWTAFGSGVTAADLVGIGQYFGSSGLQAAGYNHINSDDGWSVDRGPDGRIVADPNKFPQGIPGVVQQLAALNLSFGIYSAASSVVCSGRPGSLYNEMIDAETFSSWNVSLVKYDNCGEYSLGNTRFTVFADAVASLGSKMIISTEPFSLVPNPTHAAFAHYYRTGNDINAAWSTILDRIDRNDKWAPFSGPGHFADPDMLQLNGLSDGELRAHFGLWALAKAPLILGFDPRKTTPSQLAIFSNPGAIAVNQDPLGVQARKLAVNGTLTPRFVGLAPCAAALQGPAPNGLPGPNGVTAAGLSWTATSLGDVNGTQAYLLVNNATGRCLGTRMYMGRITPLLVPCVSDISQDLTQAWALPTGAVRIGAIQSLAAVAATAAGQNPSNATVLSVANSTVYGTVHGSDDAPLLDAAYGITVLGLDVYTPEAPCQNRNCQDYVPQQSWYWSPRSRTVSLAMSSANMYRCFEGPCYLLTTHMPAPDQMCLSHVASISNDGVDPDTTTTGGADVWGGPLAGGAYVLGLLNRNDASSSPAPITASFSMLEDPAIGPSTSACVRELFSNTQLGVVTGQVTVTVPPHDLALLRVVPGATSC